MFSESSPKNGTLLSGDGVSMQAQLLLFLAFLFFLPSPASAKATALQRILRKGEITVCARKDIPPFGFVAKKKWQGFDLELAKQIVKHLARQHKKPIQIKWKAVTAFSRLGELLNGKCDMVAAAFSMTPNRKKYIAFSEMYLQTKKVVLKRKTIKRKKPVVALVQGTTRQIVLLSGVVKTFNNYLAILEGMEKNQVDSTITDEPIARFLLKRVGSLFVLSKTLKKRERYGVGLRKQDKALLQAVNQALQGLRKNAQLKALKKKWL